MTMTMCMPTAPSFPPTTVTGTRRGTPQRTTTTTSFARAAQCTVWSTVFSLEVFSLDKMIGVPPGEEMVEINFYSAVYRAQKHIFVRPSLLRPSPPSTGLTRLAA